MLWLGPASTDRPSMLMNVVLIPEITRRAMLTPTPADYSAAARSPAMRPRVQGEAHGIARQDERIAVAVDGAGIEAAGVEARNRVLVLVQHLSLVVYLETSQSAVRAGIEPAGIEGGFPDALHVPVILLEELVEALVAQLVVLLNRLNQALGADARLLRQLLDRIRDKHRLVPGGKRGLNSHVETVEKIRADVHDSVGRDRTSYTS